MLSLRNYRLDIVLPSRKPKIEGYSDAAWGGDLDEFKSTFRYVFTLSGRAISWCSKKHGYVTLSSIEAKYVAYCLAAQDATWLMSFLQDLNLTLRVDDPVEIWCNKKFRRSIC